MITWPTPEEWAAAVLLVGFVLGAVAFVIAASDDQEEL